MLDVYLLISLGMLFAYASSLCFDRFAMTYFLSTSMY